MKKHLAFLFIVLVSCSVFLFSSPVKEPGNDVEKEDKISRLVIGTTSKIEKAERGEYAFDMLASATSELPLVWLDTNGAYHPLLADYETEDGKTWVFTLKDGLAWSDGEPVTAEDILFTFQYEDSNGSAYLVSQTDSNGKVTAAKYSSATVSEDNRSITLVLPSPNVRMLGDMTSFRIMPKHIYKGNENPTTEDNRVGCGPYTFSSFSPSSGTIVFKANGNYPEEVKVEEIVYRLFGNEDTMYLSLENGDIDMVWNYSMGTPSTYQDYLASSSKVSLIAVPATNLPAVLAFNNSKGPFEDENLRKAVSYALDYDVFKTYFGSDASLVPNRGVVPTTTVGYKETEKLAKDEEKANFYMEEAGYKKNADGVYVDENGKQMSFTLTVNGSKVTHVSYAEIVKNQLDAFGILVNIEALDSASYNAKTSVKFSEGNITMEAAIYGYTSAGMGMGKGLGTIYVDGTHAVQGGCQVFASEFQEALKVLSSATNLDEYYEGAALVQDYYSNHTPLIALYWDNLVYACSSKYCDITVDATFGLNSVNNWKTIELN